MPLTERGTRCAACGFLLAAAPSKVYSNSLPPKRARPKLGRPSALPNVVVLVGIGSIVVFAVAAFWWLRQRDEQRAAAPVSSIAVSVVAPPVASAAPALDPIMLLAQSKTRALAWHADAALVEIMIAPVVDGRVAQGGSIVSEFAKPAGRKLGPGVTVAGTALTVTADETGVRTAEHPAGKELTVPEPNCIFDDVVRNAGGANGEHLRLHFAREEKSGRAAWLIFRSGDRLPFRMLDGANCAVIVR